MVEAGPGAGHLLVLAQPGSVYESEGKAEAAFLSLPRKHIHKSCRTKNIREQGPSAQMAGWPGGQGPPTMAPFLPGSVALCWWKRSPAGAMLLGDCRECRPGGPQSPVPVPVP